MFHLTRGTNLLAVTALTTAHVQFAPGINHRTAANPNSFAEGATKELACSAGDLATKQLSLAQPA